MVKPVKNDAAVFPFTRNLSSPLIVGGREVMEITLRKPKGRDYERWGAEPDRMKRNKGLISDLSGVDTSALADLDYEDHQALWSAAEDFFAEYHPEDNPLVGKMLTSPGFMDGLRKLSPT